jgi:hypothetical protein
VKEMAWLLGCIAVITVGAVVWWLRKKRMMFRKELPRIYDLRDLLPDSPPADAYFRDLDASLAATPQKLRQFRDWERELEGLDPSAWALLKSELAPLLTARHPTRGWQQLFDKLNQAKAYNYLKAAGYLDVKFISVSRIKGQRTPDLEACGGSTTALCEVKTISVSEDEADRRATGGVGTTTDQLNAGFFAKLASDLADAKAQMMAYEVNSETRKIAYVIVNFDDHLHEYADRYQLQIERYLKINSPEGLEVVLDIKPAFSTAIM